MTQEEFYSRIFAVDPKFLYKLNAQRGLRGLFDPRCAEYKDITWSDRVATAYRLIEIFGDIKRLEKPFIQDLERRGYPKEEAKSAFHSGVCDLLTHLLIATGNLNHE